MQATCAGVSHARDGDAELLVRGAREKRESSEENTAIRLLSESEYDGVEAVVVRGSGELESRRKQRLDVTARPSRERDAAAEASLADVRRHERGRRIAQRGRRARAAPRIDALLIYGATGFSGRLLATAAVRRGLRPVLGGRDEARLAAVAEELGGLEYRVASLSDRYALDGALRDVDAVLHAAGPFSETARPMVDACLRTGTHYLDITAEIRVIEALARRDAEARARGVMLMPGVGFDVVPSDCLAAHVARRLPGARRLAIGLTGLVFVTPASAKTLVETADYGVVRRAGEITSTPIGSLERTFDYGSGPSPSLNVSWGDVATAWYTTGIPNIEVYVEATPLMRSVVTASRYFGWTVRSGPFQAWLKAWADLLPDGPTEEERATRRMIVVAEAEDAGGHRVVSRIETPEAYTFTGTVGPAIASRVLAGDLEVGFQTPARVYGADYPLSFPDVSREDLA
jgi:short subunit dehydrogenase-like uncharacterized protein